VRVRVGTSPYRFVFTFALCNCMLGSTFSVTSNFADHVCFVATARSQAPSSCMKSTVDGVPRFIQIRPSIVTLLSQIGSAEDFLFSYVLVWLACTYWISFHPWPTKSRQLGGILRPLCPSPLSGSTSPTVRKSNTQNDLPLCLHESSYYSQESPSPSASSMRVDLYEDRSTWQVLVPNRNRRRALDRLYINCLLPPGAQPGQLSNAQLHARRSRDRPYIRPGVLGFKLPESRRWFAGSRSQVRPLSTHFLLVGSVLMTSGRLA
jgi:hypothetical protein